MTRNDPSSTSWLVLFVGTLLLGFLDGISCADDAGPPAPAKPVTLIDSTIRITANDVRPHVQFLASPDLKGRGPEGKPAAREYIIGHFEKLGLKPMFDGDFLQPLPGPVDENGKPTYVGANIGAYLPADNRAGANEWIVLNAHYDHLGVRNGRIYPGADDNASSMSMLLETARQLAHSKQLPHRNIAFVAFDLEEQLLWGSRWFVAHPPCEPEQMKFCITADLLGRSLGNLPMRTVFIMGTERTPEFREYLTAANPSGSLELGFLGADMVGTRSDYGPFRDAEIPFLFFSTGEHPDYHTPNDTPDKIDYEKLADISTTMSRLCAHLGEMSEVPKWRLPDPTDPIDAKTMNRVTEALLKADEEGRIQLSGFHRTFVSQLQSKTGGAMRRGRISAEERVWLIRASQFLLISVF
ncbi:MAG: M28 family peptidase [Planctomycetaceae bacterium]